MTIIGTIIAFVFLEGVWRWALIGALALFEAFEISIFLRWRKRRSTTGAESMAGALATVVTDCRPEGQVRLKGQIWKAVCEDGASAGDDVVVTGVDGIQLQVARRQGANSS